MGTFVYSGLNVVKFKSNTVRFVVAIVVGISIFTMVGLQVERFDSSPIVLATDNGFTARGSFATHFPTPTQIIFDSRTVTVDSKQKVTAYGTTSPVPAVGSNITGPFLSPGTTLVSIQNSSLPSNPYVPGLLATISKPLVTPSDNRGDVFVYTFTVAPPIPTPTPTLTPTPTPTPAASTVITGPATPISTGGTSKLGMNQVYISDSYLCSSLNGDVRSGDLCSIKQP